MGNHAFPISNVDVDKIEVKTYADLIIKYLLQIDVEYLFGVPGGAIEPLYNALARNLRDYPTKEKQQSSHNISPIRTRNRVKKIHPIIARHESGAAFMAEGYARETGKLGVCCSTTGPGATNLITGVATAYANRSPMLVITPQIALPDFGKQGFQESSSCAIDIVGMFEHCTRYNTLISHQNQLESKLYTALIHAFKKPYGPVHISIPMDILKMPIDKNKYNHNYQVAHLFRQNSSFDELSYEKLLETLKTNKNNVLFIGGDCRHAVDKIINYAELTNTPMVTTPMGKSLINPYHPLYRGVFGFAGHSSALECMARPELDHVIAIGTSLNEMSTCGWDSVVINEKLIHICSTIDDFSHSPMAYLHLLGTIRTIFEKLYTSQGENNLPIELPDLTYVDRSIKEIDSAYFPKTIKVVNGEKIHSDSIPLKPQRVMYELASRLSKNTRFVVDVGNSWSWAIHYLMLDNVKTMRTDFGFGAMGWAIGAAVGTALGCKNNFPTVCITGDGSYLMSGQEMSVAIQNNLSIVFIILNDQALGMIKHGQRMTGAEEIGFEIPKVDFSKMAEAMGARAYVIKEPEDFERIDPKVLFKKGCGPTLIDVRIDPEEIPPMGMRIKTLTKL